MEYRRLGNSGLKVSQIGLGGNNFGARADEPTSISVVNHALDIGINFIDTAETYSQGHSEEAVGKAIRGKRPQVIIATKFGPRGVLPDQQGGSRNYIMKAVEGSLKRLDTDYIDLYYFHHPDPQTPIEETLRAMNDMVRAGKVRYIACSNFTGWQLADALWTSRQLNVESFIAVQSKYNLLDRSIERELVPCCLGHGIGIIPWGPLASGFLTGKYPPGQRIPPGSRLASPPSIYADIATEANFGKLTKLELFSKERGHNVAELAIAWLLSHPWLGSVIAGAMSPAQLSANAAAATWKLTAEDIAQLDKLV
ncbi:MAG: Aldo/keto reductase [Dehalococcoidia bacterium]|nr:Aldo/keto reductase [Dehalococcoidia bacterium]